MSEASPFPRPTFRQRFLSTAGAAPAASLEEAVLRGPAPDGGLYVPERLEPFSSDEIAALLALDDPETACARVAERLLGREIERQALEAFCSQRLGWRSPEADIDSPFPLVRLDERTFVLELFWGPTLAFKDVGAAFMAWLMGWAWERRARAQGDERPVTILVATSGDTGSAVAHAFWRDPRFRVVVLFPRDGVSEAQRKLFTTLGANVEALVVDGVFDDCQRMVKAAFADAELRRERPLASANSINVARLLPQTLYYFEALRQLPASRRERVVVAVPSGNFGNLTAGLLAKRLGLPVARFVAATNENDVVPEYLRSGRYAARSSVATLSNAMDVGDPSNLARIRWLYGDDVEAIRRDVAGHRSTDDETLRTMRRAERRSGVLLDPHTAVGLCGLRALDGERSNPGIVLATAHPAKFAEVVERATGRPLTLPDAIRRAMARAEDVLEISPEPRALRAHLLAGR